jgi:hypothetical protein
MATLGGILNVIADDHKRLMGLMNEPEDRARPPQGGQRITVQWLRLIRDTDCKYRFRYLRRVAISIIRDSEEGEGLKERPA